MKRFSGGNPFLYVFIPLLERIKEMAPYYDDQLVAN
jgi:hypothetical protein